MRSVLFAEQACDLGQDEACLELFGLTQYYVPGGAERAAAACKLGSAQGCYGQAEHVAKGWDDPSRSDGGATPERLRAAIARAYPLYQLACQRDHADACAWVGLALQTGEMGPERDPRVGLDFFERGCKLHRAHPRPLITQGYACLWRAQAHWRGLGTPKNRVFARHLLHETCRREELGCDQLPLVAILNVSPWVFWVPEATLVAAANLVALVLIFSGRAWAAVARRRRLVCRASFATSMVLAGMVGFQLWYFFWGSPRQSPAWPAVGPLVALIPGVLLLVARQRHKVARPPIGGQDAPLA